jgi:hypothetical protein
MRKLSIAALMCCGALAFASPSKAGPLSAAGSLGSEASRASMNNVTADEAVTQVRYHGNRGVRHYGWNRGHHYGWRHRYVHPRYFGPRYGYHGPRTYGYGYAPGIRLYW